MDHRMLTYSRISAWSFVTWQLLGLTSVTLSVTVSRCSGFFCSSANRFLFRALIKRKVEACSCLVKFAQFVILLVVPSGLIMMGPNSSNLIASPSLISRLFSPVVEGSGSNLIESFGSSNVTSFSLYCPWTYELWKKIFYRERREYTKIYSSALDSFYEFCVCGEYRMVW